jgi:SAM-dependent methyltransferase
MITFYSRDQLTPSAEQQLAAFDQEIRPLVGPNYPWPLRQRDWELLRVMQAVEALAPLGKVLDTGSYNTYFPLWLAKRAREVIASDLLFLRWRRNLLRRVGILPAKATEPPYSTWSSALKKSPAKIALKTVDLTAMPFADGTLDCITSISVIEHIPAIEKALAEMHRCLRPGGSLLITTDCSPEPRPYKHGVRYFSREELAQLFKPYVSTENLPAPSFVRENWCYGGKEPVVTTFVHITKR